MRAPRLTTICGLFCSLIIASAVVTPACAAPNPSPSTQAQVIDAEVSKLRTGAIQDFVDNLDADTRSVLPEFNLRELATTQGLRAFDPRLFLSASGQYLVRELLANARLMGELLVVAVLSALLQSVSVAFAGDSAAEVAHLMCFLVLVIISMNSFVLAMGVAGGALTGMSSFMTATIPILFTLLVAVGGVASAALMHPIVVMITGGVGKVVSGFVFPLLFVYAILGIVSNLSGRTNLSRLAALAKDVAVVTLGLCMTFLVGTMAVRGFAGPGLDGVAIRTSKFLAKAYVPVVGGLFADGWDAVSGCSLLLKNAVGVFGLIAVAAICLFPILKIAAIVLVYRLSAAIAQPIADPRIVALLNDLAASMLVLLGAVAAVGFMYFISITVVIGLGSMTMFAR